MIDETVAVLADVKNLFFSVTDAHWQHIKPGLIFAGKARSIALEFGHFKVPH
jgi:hypothetical protein